jgi:hypothetical protein
MLLPCAPMNRIPQALIALLFVYVALVAIGTLCWPLGRDQGIFAWIGDVILHGGVPYKDAWDVKGVLTYYTFALSQLLFGRTLWGIRAVDLIFLASTCVVLAKFMRHYCERWVVAIGIAYLALFHMLRGYWATAQPDGWATMLVLCAGAILQLPEIPSRKKRIIAGVLVGLASLYKIVFLIFLAPLAIACLRKDTGPLDLRIEKFAPVVLGTVGVIVASLVWLAAFGALGDFMQIQFEFNTGVHGKTFGWSPSMLTRRFAGYFKWYVWAGPLIAAGFVTLWVKHRDIFYTQLTQLLAACVFVAIQNKYYSYHWHPVRFSLLVIFVFGISGTWEFLRKRLDDAGGSREEMLRIAMVVGLCALAIFKGPAINREGISARILGTTSVVEYYKDFKSVYNWSFRFVSNHEAVTYLIERTHEDDAVLVWGFEAMINYMADRRSPTRFGYNYPLVAKVKDRRELGYRTQFIQQLASDPPRYIVVGVGDQNSLMKRSSKNSIQSFPRFKAFMREHYALEGHVSGFEMWRRKQDPDAGQRAPKGKRLPGRKNR